MHRRTIVAAILGAALGALAALGVLALAASRVITSGVDAVLLNQASGRARAAFVVTEGGFTVLVVVAGALAGAVLAGIGYVVSREIEPAEPRFRPSAMVTVGALTGVVAAYATARAVLGASASIEAGTISLSVFRAILLALVTGAITGGVVAGGVERLSARAVIGLQGPAVAPGPMALAREAAVAVGIPLIAAGLGAGVVGGLGYVLLEAPTEVSIGLFGGLAALVLAAAAFIASHPPRRDGD